VPSPTSPLVVATLAEGVLTAGVAAWAWRRRDDPGATAFAGLMASIAIWSLGYGVALTVEAPALRADLELVVWAGRVAVPVAWFAFALAYTGRGRLVTPRLVAVLSLSPVVTLVLVATGASQGLVWTDYRVVVRHGAALASYDYGPWFWWQITYAYGLIAGGSVLLVEPLLADDDLYLEQGAALLGGTAIAVAANLAWLLGVGPLPEADLTPAALTVTGVLFGVALFRYRLLASSPAVRLLGQRSTIDDLGDGVVVVDDERRIVDCNHEATAVLDRERSALLGEPVEAVLPADVLGRAETTVELDTDEGRRRFEVVVRPVVESNHGRIGHTLVLHDVTDREQRRQRLEVLTRALRHNLRNEMSVVQLYADELAERTTGEPAELADAIRTESAELVALSEKAESLEQLLEAARGAPAPVDLPALVESSVERLHHAPRGAPAGHARRRPGDGAVQRPRERRRARLDEPSR
jgi:PAS domain-containing protein